MALIVHRGAPCLTIVLLGLLVFGQVVSFQLVTNDDRLLIAQNPLVTGWAQAPWVDRLLTPVYGYAIPVTTASFALDWWAFQGSPAGLHLVNLLVHLGTTLLLFRILCRLTLRPAALAGALLFLIHPVQAETVAFVTQRKDLLVVFFALLALAGTLALPAGAATRRVAALPFMIVVSTALAGLAKPSGVLLGPLLGALLLLWRGQRPGAISQTSAVAGARRDRRLIIALFLTGVGVLALNLYVDSISAMALDRKPLSVALRIGIVGSTLHHYLSALLFPLALLPKVPRPITPEWGAVAVFLLCTSLLSMGLVVAVRRHAQRAQLLITWLIATYLPIANLAPISRYVADCYLYAPMFGLALGLALLVEQALRSESRGRAVLIGALLATLAVPLVLRCHSQVAIWRDEETLYRYLYSQLPSNKEAMREYAELLLRTGRRDQGLAVLTDFYQQALRAAPDSLSARHWLVRLLLQRHSPPKPQDVAAARRLVDEVPAAQQGGQAYQELRLEWAMGAEDHQAAIASVEALLRLRPDHPRRTLLPELRRLQRESPGPGKQGATR